MNALDNAVLLFALFVLAANGGSQTAWAWETGRFYSALLAGCSLTACTGLILVWGY